MSQNRPARQNLLPGTPTLAEALRNCAEQGQAAAAADGKDEQKIPVFWRIFGSTVLSIASLVLITAYQALSSGMAEIRTEMSALNAEMRKELARLTEAQADLVRKDECVSRIATVWRNVGELQDDKKDFFALKERCAALSALHKESEEQRRKLAADLAALREQGIQQDERRSLAAELGALRERLAGLEGKNSVSTPAPPAPKDAAEEPAEPKKVGWIPKLIEKAAEVVRQWIPPTDPNVRIEQLLNQSEHSGISLDEAQQWIRGFPSTNPQSHLTYDRVNGGIQ